jgi:hypothetical protein
MLISVYQITLMFVSLLFLLGYVLLQLAKHSVAPLFLFMDAVLIGMIIMLEPIAKKVAPVKQICFTSEGLNSGKITPQAVKLSEALRCRGVNNALEYDDGHKHVDICVPEANLYIEIDGKYHLTDSEHLFRDLQRDAFSHNEGVDTIRIPNLYVENNLDELANAIAEVARKRQKFGTSLKNYRRSRY